MFKKINIIFIMILFCISLSIFANKKVEITVHPPKLIKGSCSIVKVKSTEKPKIYLGNRRLPVFLSDNYYVALLVTDIADKRKKVYVEVIVNKKSYLQTVHLLFPKVRKREFTIPPKKNKYVGPSKKKKKFNKLVNKVRTKVSSQLLFKSEFMIPIKNIRIKDLYFGDQRILHSGKKTIRYFHRGIDFGARRGTPVYAMNSGKVVLARKLYSRGNAIFIDHGWGIYSEYLHLHKILIKEGQVVQKGQKIAQVGSTGVSTGPHLHLSMIVNGYLVSPLFWMRPLVAEVLKKPVMVTKN